MKIIVEQSLEELLISNAANLVNGGIDPSTITIEGLLEIARNYDIVVKKDPLVVAASWNADHTMLTYTTEVSIESQRTNLESILSGTMNSAVTRDASLELTALINDAIGEMS